ncbi:hypothetical protein [Flavihumibacter fluvii]|uniref:hypothetical protein n=1 Tax=Flavihumibacter fluvii TaxID=2838157 RepID=UPI001BDEA9BE|nr:hypothetical protein [Flavihumibacter fluvii]ULQ51884.1 hypothetical protein KJS93_17485 [Flavihumibacter fluvii]
MSHYSTLQQLMGSFNFGLFFNLSSNHIKLPNGIVRVLDVDDAGYCWFLFQYSVEDTFDIETEFPARFRLYEKGRDCYVEVNGTAAYITDPGEWTKCAKISYGMAKALQYQGLVIRLQIEQAIVYQCKRYSRRNKVQKIMDGVESWVNGKRVSETIYQSAISLY